jgi:hypothetical protein
MADQDCGAMITGRSMKNSSPLHTDFPKTRQERLRIHDLHSCTTDIERQLAVELRVGRTIETDGALGLRTVAARQRKSDALL